MKLNLDCLRDILLTVEEGCTFDSYVCLSVDDSIDDNPPIAEDYPHLKKYLSDEIFYHVRQCDLSGLLYEVKWFISGSCLIQDLTPEGHKFLSDIRSDTNWNKTKDIVQKVGSSSLDVVKSIAAEVIASLIKSQF